MENIGIVVRKIRMDKKISREDLDVPKSDQYIYQSYNGFGFWKYPKCLLKNEQSKTTI